METKAPRDLAANGLWNIFTKRKRYTVLCGGCPHTYRDKVSFDTDRATSLCPACGTLNMWKHSDWQRHYDQEIAKRHALENK